MLNFHFRWQALGFTVMAVVFASSPCLADSPLTSTSICEAYLTPESDLPSPVKARHNGNGFDELIEAATDPMRGFGLRAGIVNGLWDQTVWYSGPWAEDYRVRALLGTFGVQILSEEEIEVGAATRPDWLPGEIWARLAEIERQHFKRFEWDTEMIRKIDPEALALIGYAMALAEYDEPGVGRLFLKTASKWMPQHSGIRVLYALVNAQQAFNPISDELTEKYFANFDMEDPLESIMAIEFDDSEENEWAAVWPVFESTLRYPFPVDSEDPQQSLSPEAMRIIMEYMNLYRE